MQQKDKRIIKSVAGQVKKMNKLEKKINALILNCDLDKSKETNGAQLLKKHLQNMKIENIEIKNAFDNKFPSEEELKNADKILITGSRASIYEKNEYTWIEPLIETIKKIKTLKIPTLGICFGYQAIAYAFGGEVKSSGFYEMGFKEIELTCQGRKNQLFSGFSDKFKVYQHHGDIVSKFPDNAIMLAMNNFSFQSYQLNNFFCVQFHPEILPETAIKMAVRDKRNVEEIMNGIKRNEYLTEKIIHNFTKIK